MGNMFAGQIETDEEITRLIGIFVARWSLAEYSLMLAFLAATQSNRQEVATTVLAATASAEAKIRIVQKLLGVAALPEDRRVAIRRAVKQLEGLCQERNELMHHLWARRDTGEIVTIDYRDNGQKIRTVESLKALCNSVVEATHAISKATGSTWINEVGVQALKV